ncbi:MAG: phospholipase [Pseudomonadales bacterium]|nr:phospholipase [Pseudomonadales bacterium]
MRHEAQANDSDHEQASLTPPRSRGRWRISFSVALLLFIGICAINGARHSLNALPRGVDVTGQVTTLPADDIRFLTDLTHADAYGRPLVEQQIFDHVLKIIGNANDFLVLDFFLFNHQSGALAPGQVYRPLSSQLRDALIARKEAVPALRVLLVTDPINDVYGGDPSADLRALRAAGIDVILTDLDRLRDSNPLYSGFWRTVIDWWAGDGSGPGWLPNPLEGGPSRVTFRAWARLLNFKANHRKLVIGDDGAGKLVGIVTSANPHDASSAHSNVAIQLSGDALRPLLQSEIEIARFSGWRGNLRPYEAADDRQPPEPLGALPSITPAAPIYATAQALTEGAIKAAVLQRLAATEAHDSIDVAMFYLADRAIIEALLQAAARGVEIRVILDPNKDAFGRTKSGIPNRPVASELVAASDGAIKIRWYRTHGEQFHVKLLVIKHAASLWFTLGSANFTRRNLNNFNLEANVAIEVPTRAPLAEHVTGYFDRLWSNRDAPDSEYTADYPTWADPAQSSYWLYRLMEGSGVSTF